jgi:hypothetical protein
MMFEKTKFLLRLDAGSSDLDVCQTLNSACSHGKEFHLTILVHTDGNARWLLNRKLNIPSRRWPDKFDMFLAMRGLVPPHSPARVSQLALQLVMPWTDRCKHPGPERSKPNMKELSRVGFHGTRRCRAPKANSVPCF